MSKIEAELLKITGEEDEGRKEGRQNFLDRLAEAASKLPDAKWNKLSADAQKWANAANQAVEDKEDIEDFEDAGQEEDEPPARSRRAAAEDDEPPARSRGRKDEEDDEPPARGRGSRKDEEEDEPPARGRGRGRDEEDDEPPARSRRAKDEEDDEPPARSRRAKDEEEDEPPARSRRGKDEEEDEPPARGSRRGKEEEADEPEAEETVPAALKNKIKAIILETPAASVDAIIKKLGAKVTVSKTTVSGIRTEFRHSIKFLQDNKQLKKAIL